MSNPTHIDLLERFRSDAKRFSVMFLPSLLTDESPLFHDEMFHLLMTKDRLAIAAPRGFAKSTVCAVAYPIWCALLGMRKDIFIISASETLALEFLRKIKLEFEINPLIKKYFGDVRSEVWNAGHIILKNGCQIRARGAGSQIRGARPDLIILDDFESDESCESEDQRRKLRDWLFKAVINTLLPKGQLVVAGTLIHPLSVLTELVDTPRQGWIRKKYQAYIDGVEAEGHELWPKSRSHQWLQQRKAEIGSFAFASEYMNNPMANSEAPIKPEHIRYYETLPSRYNVVLAIDPAYSEEIKADFKVCMCVAVDMAGNRYVIDYLRTHAPTGEFMNAALNMYVRHKEAAISFGIPSQGLEKEFYRSFVNKASERNIFPPLTELTNTWTTAEGQATIRNKRKRIIAALQSLFESGKYYIKEEHTELREELLTFMSSRHDDTVDALAYCEALITPSFYHDNSEFSEYSDEITENDPVEAWGIEY